MDFTNACRTPHIISYNTYRKYARKHDIKDKTNNGKPITYNKLKHKIDDYMNKQKSAKPEPFKALLMSYMNDKIDHDEFMTTFINRK